VHFNSRTYPPGNKCSCWQILVGAGFPIAVAANKQMDSHPPPRLGRVDIDGCIPMHVKTPWAGERGSGGAGENLEINSPEHFFNLHALGCSRYRLSIE